MRLPIVAFAVALFATLGLAGQDSRVATGKTSASTKKSTGTAHSAQKSSQVKSSQVKKAPPAAVHHTAAAAKTPAARPAATPSKTAHRRTPTSSTRTATVATRHSTQQQPTPDRFLEIQQAMADRGYFSGAVNGAWGADSVDALKRFQRDQNIADDGKIGSLSLIALGLGPKRVASAEAPPEKPNPQR